MPRRWQLERQGSIIIDVGLLPLDRRAASARGFCRTFGRVWLPARPVEVSE
jgi:hypothetical protein